MYRYMKYIFILIIFILLSTFAFAANSANLLVFDANKSDGCDSISAQVATKAIKNYYNETGRVSASFFDRESPSVLRALMEGSLTADKVASYSSREERMGVAKILNFGYVSGSEISITDGVVQVKLWLAKVGGNKKERWESIRSSTSQGTENKDIENAINSAASAVVFDLSSKAFSALPVIKQQQSDDNSSKEVVLTKKTSEELAAMAQTSLKNGNIALAITYFNKATDDDPNNGILRIELGKAYIQKGMTAQAKQEFDRAIELGVDPKTLDAIEQKPEVVGKNKEPERVPESVQEEVEEKAVVKIAPKVEISDPTNKIAEGDNYWTKGDIQKAITSYRIAIGMNPSDWLAYERLAIAYAAASQFGDSKNVLAQLALIQPNPPENIARNRFIMLIRTVDKQLTSVINQYANYRSLYDRQKLSREKYYNAVKATMLQSDSLSKFIESIPAYGNTKSQLIRRSLACGLISQSAASTIDFLETNNEKSKQNATLFFDQASSEISSQFK